jgi:hypothetical protein
MTNSLAMKKGMGRVNQETDCCKAKAQTMVALLGGHGLPTWRYNLKNIGYLLVV